MLQLRPLASRIPLRTPIGQLPLSTTRSAFATQRDNMAANAQVAEARSAKLKYVDVGSQLGLGSAAVKGSNIRRRSASISVTLSSAASTTASEHTRTILQTSSPARARPVWKR